MLGELADVGWGASDGFPGLVAIGSGQRVTGQLLEASSLDWARLDAFEGTDYVRQTAEVTLVDGSVVSAEVYVIAG